MKFRLLSAPGESALSLWAVSGPEAALMDLLGGSLPPRNLPQVRNLRCARGGILDQALVWHRLKVGLECQIEVHLHGGFGVAALFRQAMAERGFLESDVRSKGCKPPRDVQGLGSWQARWRWSQAGTDPVPFLHPPQVVLAGPANAGKSSIFNAWLGQERVTVSAHPGTTRDAIEAGVLLGLGQEDLEICLVDTAGFENSASGPVGQAAAASTAARIASAWCVLWVLDASQEPSKACLQAIAQCQGPAIRLLHKVDLEAVWKPPFAVLRGSVQNDANALILELEMALAQNEKLAAF